MVHVVGGGWRGARGGVLPPETDGRGPAGAGAQGAGQGDAPLGSAATPAAQQGRGVGDRVVVDGDEVVDAAGMTGRGRSRALAAQAVGDGVGGWQPDRAAGGRVGRSGGPAGSTPTTGPDGRRPAEADPGEESAAAGRYVDGLGAGGVGEEFRAGGALAGDDQAWSEEGRGWRRSRGEAPGVLRVRSRRR